MQSCKLVVAVGADGQIIKTSLTIHSDQIRNLFHYEESGRTLVTVNFFHYRTL